MVPSESPANKQFEFGAIPIVFSSTPGWNGIDIIGSKLKIMDQSWTQFWIKISPMFTTYMEAVKSQISIAASVIERRRFSEYFDH